MVPARGGGMIPKHIDQIATADLYALRGVRESKTLEFKRELVAGPPGYRKLVAGVSALANTSGGDFVIGVTEAAGAAVEFSGMPHDDIDAYKRSLAQVLASQIEPALPNIDMREVSCGEDRWVLIIRVARSWIGPHRSLYDNHFYVRTAGPATVALGVGELRTAFGLRESGIERIEAFRSERLVKIMAGATPIPVHDGPAIVLHMAPLPSFANRDLIDVVTLVSNGTHFPLPLRGMGANRPRVNLLGMLTATGADDRATGYGQLFRTGAYEGFNCASDDGLGRYVASIDFANMIVSAARYFLAFQASYQIAFPTFAMLSFCKATSLRMRTPTEIGAGYYETPPLGEEMVAFPEILLERQQIDVASALRPLLNIVWNAFGLPNCDMFTPQGAWKGIV
jgi:Putative DNA-binding domain